MPKLSWISSVAGPQRRLGRPPPDRNELANEDRPPGELDVGRAAGRLDGDGVGCVLDHAAIVAGEARLPADAADDGDRPWQSEPRPDEPQLIGPARRRGVRRRHLAWPSAWPAQSPPRPNVDHPGLADKRPRLAPSCRTGPNGNGRKEPERTRWPNRPAAPAICAFETFAATSLWRTSMLATSRCRGSGSSARCAPSWAWRTRPPSGTPPFRRRAGR